jgi:hypothetical protein
MALTEGLTDELRVRVSVACVGRVRSGMDVKDGWMDGWDTTDPDAPGERG